MLCPELLSYLLIIWKIILSHMLLKNLPIHSWLLVKSAYEISVQGQDSCKTINRFQQHQKYIQVIYTDHQDYCTFNIIYKKLHSLLKVTSIYASDNRVVAEIIKKIVLLLLKFFSKPFFHPLVSNDSLHKIHEISC